MDCFTARRAHATVISGVPPRSEEHTSELQSQSNLVCRLLLEKKKKMYAQPVGIDAKGKLRIISFEGHYAFVIDPCTAAAAVVESLRWFTVRCLVYSTDAPPL